MASAGNIGESVFKHDFNNIQFDVAEFNQRAGTPGLHTIRPMNKNLNVTPYCPLMFLVALRRIRFGETKKW